MWASDGMIGKKALTFFLKQFGKYSTMATTYGMANNSPSYICRWIYFCWRYVTCLGESTAIVAATRASENGFNMLSWDTLAPYATSLVLSHEGLVFLMLSLNSVTSV